jgi:hypothetical protein
MNTMIHHWEDTLGGNGQQWQCENGITGRECHSTLLHRFVGTMCVRMALDIAAYVRGCHVSHRIKPVNKQPFGMLEQLEIPEER